MAPLHLPDIPAVGFVDAKCRLGVPKSPEHFHRHGEVVHPHGLHVETEIQQEMKIQQEKMQNRDTSGMDDPDVLITKLELCEKIALVDPHRCQDELRLLLEKVKEWKEGSTEER